jgi:hypothetical protein
MKNLIANILFIQLLFFAISCEDSVPRDRPTYSTDELLEVTDTDTVTEPELLEIPTRPSGAVIVQSDFCGCQAGKAVTIGNCEATCSSKQASSDASEVLFFNVALTENITLDTYEDLAGWCGREIIDPNTSEAVSTGVECSMEVKNEAGSVVLNIPFGAVAGSNSQKINITGIDADTTYRFTLVESSSGARSTTFQVRKESTNDENTQTGPLMLMPVSQYTCIFRAQTEFDENTGELIITDVNRFHFYFNSETRPEPLQEATTSTVYCHDIEKFNTPVASPLLEETTGSYTVWNKNDPRFYDLKEINTPNKIDIDEIVYEKVLLQGAVLTAPPNLFMPISWPNQIDDGDSSAGGSSGGTLSPVTKQLGYAMRPFLDDNTYKAYCPTQLHYYSTNPIFKALRDLVGDTEALYAAKQENVLDYLLVRESILKNIWFYVEGGQNIEPTSDTIQGKKIQFYWPADAASPFIKKSHQRVYTVTAASELSGDNTVETGVSNGEAVRTNYPTHDKRIACIPVLLN